MKQLVIIACTISVGTQSEVKTRAKLLEFTKMLHETFNEALEDETSTKIKFIITPTQVEQPTKIECIYPKDGIIIEKIKGLTI